MPIPLPKERHLQYGLAILWLALQSFFIFRYGVRVMGDSEAYVTYGRNIAEHFYFADNYQLKYVGYPIFLAVIFKLGFGLKGVIICQTLISGLAAVALYKTTHRLAGNYIAPVLATLLFIGWYDLQFYNGFILTESLYISSLIFAFHLLAKSRSIRQSVWVVPVLFYIALIRPNGFIAFVAYFAYLFTIAFTSIRSTKYKTVLALLVTLIPLAAILVVDRYLLQQFTIVETYQKGQLIFWYDGLLVHSDKPIVMPPADASPLAKMLLFIKENTSYFLRMSLYRFLLFWGNVKPFYSVLHNAVIVLVLYPLYFFSVKAMVATKRMPLPLSMFVAFLLLQQCFITTVTSEDWNGRFLMSLIAFVFMYGSIGISWQLEKWWPKYKPSAKAAVPAAP
ncbi:hypothetical protein [Pontibacter cellulosilyticus]|uniref:Uncharacterized protein n=1 Tax=Pontibacter cellulosilyticus TaxID=1720253 RepID=A0A923NCC5_9BACT|nr:hypothetical protein [Pontibacter cellulosilyticus]MBC5994802.1 hypothetical protein [Pontibacter cellulosilyticus]